MEAFTLEGKITLELGEALSRIETMEKELDNLTAKNEKHGAAWGKFAKGVVGAVAGAATAVSGFAASSIKTGMAFDSSVSQLSATMADAAQDQIVYNGQTMDAIDALREKSKELGATTMFTSQQAADGFNVLAMAGMSAEESLDTLPDVMHLAAAGGLDIAQAADYATGIMAGFGESAGDAGKVADYLATMASKAKGDVSTFGEALSTVAGMASTTGQSMDTAAVALEILGNHNIAASEAGNALSRTLKNLYQPTATGAKGLEALGVNAYDAAGNARPLNDVLLDLNEATKDMSTEAKNQALSQIFDAATLKTVPFLIDDVATSWEGLSNDLKESDGAAEEMEKTMTDNLQGALTLFSSAVDGLKTSVSDVLSPVFKDFVNVTTDGISGITEAFTKGGISEAMDAVGKLFGNLLNKAIEILPKVTKAGTELLLALVKGIIDNLPALMNAAVEVVTSLVSGIAKALPELIPAMATAVVTMVEGLVNNMDLLISCAVELIEGLTQGLIGALPILIQAAPQLIGELVAQLIANTPLLVECAVQLIVALATGLISAIPQLLAAVPRLIMAIVNTFVHYDWKKMGKHVIDGIVSAIKNGISTVVTSVKNLGKSMLETFKSIFKINSPSKVMKALSESIPEGIAVGIEANADQVYASMEDIRDNIAQPFDMSVVGVSKMAGTKADQFSDKNIVGALQEIKDYIGNTQVVLSTGETVGALTPHFDRSLGAVHDARARSVV